MLPQMDRRPVMLAMLYDEYGEPDVLRLGEAPEPHAGPGQVRIAVRAVSVNPFDCKLRAGQMAGIVPLTFPAIPGTDASGVVDEVGDGVEAVKVGDPVFGLGSQTSAQFALLDHFSARPAEMPAEEAAASGLAVEAAARCLDMVDLPAGSTLLLDGAAGGVGSAATQLAVARGLHVIGTASPAQHEYLRTLGATPTTYGSGLPERVAALAPQVDAAIDLVGKGSVPELITITGDPGRVVSLADFSAGQFGARVADGSTPRATYAFATVAELYRQGRFAITIERVFPLSEAAEAHRLSESGHVRGKLVLTVPEG